MNKNTLLVLSLTLCSAYTAQCQYNGLLPSGRYDNSFFDTVDLDHRTVQLHIPLASFPQKGTLPPLTLEMVFNTPTWSLLEAEPGYTLFDYWFFNNENTFGPVTHNGLVFTPFYTPYQTILDPFVTQYEGGPRYLTTLGDATGASHLLWDTSFGVQSTIDGSQLFYSELSNSVEDRMGIQYGGCSDPSTCQAAVYMTDPNGNKVLRYADHFVDSLGRNIPSFGIDAPQSGCWTKQFPTFGESTTPITVCYADFPVSIGGADGIVSGNYVYTGIQSITLQNGTQWLFGYDIFGSLQQVVSPTGAVMSYEYVSGPNPAEPGVQRIVSKRTLVVNNDSYVWQYSRDASGGVTVTTSDGSVTYGTPAASGAQYKDTNGNVLKTVKTDLVQFVNVFELYSPLALPTRTRVTLDNGMVSQNLSVYDGDAGADCSNAGSGYGVDKSGVTINDPWDETLKFGFIAGVPKVQCVWDYGAGAPGPLLSQTEYSYKWETVPSYLQANLRSLLTSTTVYQPNTTSNSPITLAKTSYEYDEQNGSPAGVRGNQTSSTHLLTSPTVWQTVGGGTSPRTQTIYNESGMPSTLIDAQGGNTTITYDATGAYPYFISAPSTTGPNGLVSHGDTYSYDRNTGLLSSHTDSNGQSTSYVYDSSNRPTSVTYPTGGGNASYIYNDMAPNPSVSWTRSQNELVAQTGVNVADALGRTIRSATTSTPDGFTYTDTTYDPMGRVASMSSPYHPNASAPSTTGYTYDGLGRIIQTTNPDRSFSSVSYTGNQTRKADEAGNASLLTYDALNRLTKVGLTNSGVSTPPCTSSLCPQYGVSSPSGPGPETDYSYDALGNLTTVIQNGQGTEVLRRRSFTYDSLSRLITSDNPETKVVCYGKWSLPPQSGDCLNGYDASSNLRYKTDARGAEVDYSYDALNRLVSKTYPVVPAPAIATDPVSYVYDVSPAVPVLYSMGRLVTEYTGSAANPTTQRSILEYDGLGRVKQDQQCATPDSCASAPASFQYTYDLAGHVTSATNGDPNVPIGWNYVYDGAGRLQMASSTWDDATHPATLFAPPSGLAALQYGPAGLAAASIGVPTGSMNSTFITQRTYDSRLRLIGETDSGEQSSAAGAGTISFTGGDGTRTKKRGACSALNCGPMPDFGVLLLTFTLPTGSFYWRTEYRGEDDVTLAGEVAATLSGPDEDGNPAVVSATASGNVVVMTSLAVGSGSNYPFALSVSNDSDYARTVSGSTLVGGRDATGPSAPIYSYGVTYTGNSNVQSMSDTVMGNWAYGYDGYNRLMTAQAGANPQTGFAPYQAAQLSWSYDSFGNLLSQSLSGSTQATASQGTFSYLPNNHIVGVSYDNSGNQAAANSAQLAYDAEGRLVNVDGQVTYRYDAEGRRVAKLQYAAATLHHPASLAPTNIYLLGLNGEQVTEQDGGGNWLHSNAYADGKLLATYDQAGLHFHFTDWLGTRRVQASGTGQVEQQCQSLPFGDSQQCSGIDSTEHHFTGKERDQESGLDYFGFRYYGSSMGRWMSPDPSGLAFADPTNPQSLNLYSYVLNNPLSFIDPDGLECVWDDGSFDSAGDKQTGTHGGCSAQGGTYVDPKAFGTLNAGDWSGEANRDIANVASTLSASNNFTNVNVSADGSGYVDQTYMNMSNNVPYMLTNDSTTAADPTIALATAVTADANHMTGCIAGAYGFGGPGEAGRYMGQPVEGTKPFITPGTSRGSSPVSEMARSLPRVRGNFRAPVGGPGTGTSLRLARTGSLNVAAARWVPFVGLAMDIYAVGQLANCLGH